MDVTHADQRNQNRRCPGGSQLTRSTAHQPGAGREAGQKDRYSSRRISGPGVGTSFGSKARRLPRRRQGGPNLVRHHHHLRQFPPITMTITARAIGVRGDKRNVTTLHSSRLHSDGSIREAEIVRKTTAKTVYARKGYQRQCRIVSRRNVSYLGSFVQSQIMSITAKE